MFLSVVVASLVRVDLRDGHLAALVNGHTLSK
jgi:hypothetical protein